MKRFTEALYWVAIAAWAGSLWTIGFVVAPTLFGTLDDRALAGRLAGVLFDRGAWIGIGCALYILSFRFVRFGSSAFRHAVVWITLAMLALILVGKFGVQPILAGLRDQALSREIAETVFRQRFGTWHGVSSVLYVVQSVLALALVTLQRSGSR
ncbi:MAG: DUF4149 domain-containing protein [Proteobacteria bacterium]|nr:DUF4149 domain-containing protein [Burkholderiales bacterium]